MNLRIDDAGQNVQACDIDDLAGLSRREVPNRCNLPIENGDIPFAFPIVVDERAAFKDQVIDWCSHGIILAVMGFNFLGRMCFGVLKRSSSDARRSKQPPPSDHTWLSARRGDQIRDLPKFLHTTEAPAVNWLSHPTGCRGRPVLGQIGQLWGRLQRLPDG